MREPERLQRFLKGEGRRGRHALAYVCHAEQLGATGRIRLGRGGAPRGLRVPAREGDDGATHDFDRFEEGAALGCRLIGRVERIEGALNVRADAVHPPRQDLVVAGVDVPNRPRAEVVIQDAALVCPPLFGRHRLHQSVHDLPATPVREHVLAQEALGLVRDEERRVAAGGQPVEIALHPRAVDLREDRRSAGLSRLHPDDHLSVLNGEGMVRQDPREHARAANRQRLPLGFPPAPGGCERPVCEQLGRHRDDALRPGAHASRRGSVRPDDGRLNNQGHGRFWPFCDLAISRFGDLAICSAHRYRPPPDESRREAQRHREDRKRHRAERPLRPSRAPSARGGGRRDAPSEHARGAWRRVRAARPPTRRRRSAPPTARRVPPGSPPCLCVSLLRLFLTFPSSLGRFPGRLRRCLPATPSCPGGSA